MVMKLRVLRLSLIKHGTLKHGPAIIIDKAWYHTHIKIQATNI